MHSLPVSDHSACADGKDELHWYCPRGLTHYWPLGLPGFPTENHPSPCGCKMSLAQADWLIGSLNALERSDGGRGVCLTAEAELAAGSWQVMVRADVVVHR